MEEEERVIYQASNKGSSLRQGEILTGVLQYNPVPDEIKKESQDLSFKPVEHPYAIIITQDCDLIGITKLEKIQTTIQLSSSTQSFYVKSAQQRQLEEQME